MVTPRLNNIHILLKLSFKKLLQFHQEIFFYYSLYYVILEDYLLKNIITAFNQIKTLLITYPTIIIIILITYTKSFIYMEFVTINRMKARNKLKLTSI